MKKIIPGLVCLLLIISCKSNRERAMEYFNETKTTNDRYKKFYLLDKVIQCDPEFVDAYIMRGDLDAQGKGADFDAALKDFNKALELEPENSKALALRAALYNATSDYDKALTDINKAITIKPDTFSYYKIRSYIYDDIDSTKEAKVDLLKAISLNDTCIVCWFNLGVLHQNHEEDSAIEIFSRCLRIDSTFVNALINRGILFAAQKKYDKAVEDFSRGIMSDSTAVVLYKHRGLIYGLMDKNKLAIEDFKTYLAEIPPGSSDYYDVRNAIDDLEKKGKIASTNF